jgi:hypothetical protein
VHSVLGISLAQNLCCVVIDKCFFFNLWSIILSVVGLQALERNHSVVTYEVMLSIQRLVNKYGVELQDPAWDLVLSIAEAIIKYIGLFSHCSFIIINRH